MFAQVLVIGKCIVRKYADFLLVLLSPWLIVEIRSILVTPILVALEDAPQSLLSQCLFHSFCCQHTKMLTRTLMPAVFFRVLRDFGIPCLQNVYL